MFTLTEHITQDGSNKLLLKIFYCNFVLFCLQVGESTEANMQSYALERTCAAAHEKCSAFARFEIVRIMGLQSSTVIYNLYV
jgi:hypothetical protein